MSLQVLDEKVNPLLGRREVRLVIQHLGAGTPDRVTVRKMASDHYKTTMEQVYVRSIATRTGGSNAVCIVEVYDKPLVKGKSVPAFVKNRNLPKDQRVSKGKKSDETAKPSPAPTPAATPKPAAPKPADKPAAAPTPPKPATPTPTSKPAAPPSSSAKEKPKK
jgi:ribosomal protein S24E